MATMARDLPAQDSVGATLERISASATELVEGCEAAGVLILHGKQVESLAPTEHVVIGSDQLQERLQEGPCFDAAHNHLGGRVFRIADFTAHIQRWPATRPPGTWAWAA